MTSSYADNPAPTIQRSGAFDLAAALAEFSRQHPRQSATANAFHELLRAEDNPFVRTRLLGHFTGSAFLVSHDGARVLLTHHRKLDRWLQLGGHADGDRDLASVALREAREESGLATLTLEPALFDIDVHEIPARGAEPLHRHFDARFIVRAGCDEAFAVSDESHQLAWWLIADLVGDPRIDESLQRMASRWLELR